MLSAKNIDAYIKQFPAKKKEKLTNLRKLIHSEAPKAEEAIKYGMPTFVLHGNLIHFAAFKKHIGLYPTPSAIQAFAKELIPYTTSKGAIQFPLDKPLPLSLIKKIVKFRVKENKKN